MLIAYSCSLWNPGTTAGLSADPGVNPFTCPVNDTLEIKNGRGHSWTYPKKIDFVGNFSECWFKGGSTHNEPKGFISLHLMTSIPDESVLSSALLFLLPTAINEQLSTKLADAKAALYDSSLSWDGSFLENPRY